MKRIGILTFHRSINYGAYLQCFVFSHWLQSQLPGCQVEVVDYTSKKRYNRQKVILRKSHLKRPSVFFKDIKKRQRFTESLRYLPLSQRTIISDESTEVFRFIKENYDIIIVGSDAVWNWVKRGFPNPYLLNMQGDTIKMSYAASSFGMGMEEVTPEKRSYFQESLQKFSFIGVRDQYTTDLVKNVCPDANPVFTCDPTILTDMDFIEKVCGTTRNELRQELYQCLRLDDNRRIIGVMSGNDAVVGKLREYYSDKYEFVSLYTYNDKADAYLYDLSPLEWSMIFRAFDLTITDYFHGTLLSLKNETPTIAIDRAGFSLRYTGKIEDVLLRMGLHDNYFHYNNERAVGWMNVVDRVDLLLRDPSCERQRIAAGIAELAKSADRIIDAITSL